MGDAFDLAADPPVQRVLLVQGLEDQRGGMQRVDSGVRHRRMPRLAVHRDFHLQAAVVAGDHLVAETCGDQQVRLGQALAQQPARAEFAAELLVVGEIQLHAALAIRLHRFDRPRGEGEGREVAFADGRGAAIELAVDDLAAIGVVGPALTGRHDIAVRVQTDRSAGAVSASHDQVGEALESCGPHLMRRHRVLLGFETKSLEQFGRAIGMGRVVARRRVGRYLHQLLQETHFFVEMGVDPGIQGLF